MVLRVMSLTMWLCGLGAAWFPRQPRIQQTNEIFQGSRGWCSGAHPIFYPNISSDLDHDLRVLKRVAALLSPYPQTVQKFDNLGRSFHQASQSFEGIWSSCVPTTGKDCPPRHNHKHQQRHQQRPSHGSASCEPHYDEGPMTTVDIPPSLNRGRKISADLVGELTDPT